MTKHVLHLFKSSPPKVDLIRTDHTGITVPGTSYTPEQLGELRAALGEHLLGLGRTIEGPPAGPTSYTRTVYRDRSGNRELAYLEHNRLTVSAYSLDLPEAEDFYRLLTAYLAGDECPGVPEQPRIVPTPIHFQSTCTTN